MNAARPNYRLGCVNGLEQGVDAVGVDALRSDPRRILAGRAKGDEAERRPSLSAAARTRSRSARAARSADPKPDMAAPAVDRQHNPSPGLLARRNF